MPQSTAQTMANRTLTITREFQASRQLLWEVWTQPEHIRHWWGPNGFRSTIQQMNVSPGGEWDLIMHGPDGTDYKNKSRYTEVVKYERIEYEHVSAPHFRFTVRFEELTPERTALHITMLFESAEQREAVIKTFKADEGLRQNMDKLEVYLAKGYPADEIIFTRLVKAPRELVFRAWTDPQMLCKWWGPGGFSNPVCEFEAVPNGKIFIVMKAPDGTEYPMNGTVTAITAPEKLEFISAALDENNQPLFEVHSSLSLTDESGDTRLKLQVQVRHVKEGAAPYLRGMNDGWSQSLERLLNLVE